MKCLKCGRETDQSFCKICREEMDQYPVRPNSVILIPKDRSSEYSKRNQDFRPQANPDAVIRRQQKQIRHLSWTIIALIILMGSGVYIGYRLVHVQNIRPIGQNYSSVVKSLTPTEITEIPDVTEPTEDTTEETAAAGETNASEEAAAVEETAEAANPAEESSAPEAETAEEPTEAAGSTEGT